MAVDRGRGRDGRSTISTSIIAGKGGGKSSNREAGTLEYLPLNALSMTANGWGQSTEIPLYISL